MAIKPMLCKIRKNLEGLFLNGFKRNHILSPYTDDVIVVVRTQEDFTKLGEIVRDLGILWAAKVNWEKSEALAVGRCKRGLLKLPGVIKWKRDGFKYLGVFLGSKNVMGKNWEGIFEKLKGKLKKWKWVLPQLSFRGRTLIINNLVASQLWHKIFTGSGKR